MLFLIINCNELSINVSVILVVSGSINVCFFRFCIFVNFNAFFVMYCVNACVVEFSYVFGCFVVMFFDCLILCVIE